MIFKPSEVTPLCALKVAEILVEAGLPAGAYNVVQGYGDVGAALVGRDEVEKVSLKATEARWERAFKYIAERPELRVLRDPFSNKPFVHFYATKRVGGQVLDSNAIKLLKIEDSVWLLG